MKSQSHKALAALALVATLALAGCSSSGSDAGKDSSSTSTEQTAAPKVDEKIKAQLNPEPGQAIIPGSIKSTEQTGLSAACEAAVKPIRAVMAEYKSGLAVAPDKLNAVAQQRAKAEEACDPQEYTDWYTKEFAGWLYAKAN